jgi:Phage derived protein Gp49-like (DUF891)
VIPAAERELKALSGDLQGRFLHVAGMLEEFGPHRVRLPHVRQLDGKLWEMRLAGRHNIARAIYFAPQAGAWSWCGSSSRSHKKRRAARSLWPRDG